MKHLLFAACCLASVGFFHAAAQEPQTPPARPEFAPPLSFSLNPEDYEDKDLAARMIAARQNVLKSINDRRAEIIRTNPTAKKLREEILELHRKLASVVAEDSEMIRMNARLSELDVKIGRLERADKNAEAKPKDAAPSSASAPQTKPKDAAPSSFDASEI